MEYQWKMNGISMEDEWNKNGMLILNIGSYPQAIKHAKPLENPGPTWWIFQQAMFDCQRIW